MNKEKMKNYYVIMCSIFTTLVLLLIIIVLANSYINLSKKYNDSKRTNSELEYQINILKENNNKQADTITSYEKQLEELDSTLTRLENKLNKITNNSIGINLDNDDAEKR